MATAEQLKALLRSYAEGDDERFIAISMQVASHAARKGQGKFAQELRALIDQAKLHRSTSKLQKPVPIARATGELAGLLSATYPKVYLGDMVLPGATADQLGRVAQEYRQQHKLRAHGLSARRKLLLVGPPGAGKTMTASALAGELNMPLLAVQLHGVITKFMGESAAKLRLIFDAMHETRGVYLFDEFDAIGGARDLPNDVGEMRRILNSFLQFLEQDDSDSIIIAATNHESMLDSALFRRFDDVVRYELPSPELARRLIENRLSVFGVQEIRWKDVLDAANGLSYAELARACDDAARRAVLSDSTSITTETLLSALSERRSINKL
ncbi:AAA family ATPase [Tautonia sociabilis]|uniref:ATP-binding protein n=1 Tax=Tautonia sociabilis TaxID=2080755 RepID=A0A432MCI5_9BACT|nr:ATP-binding protein [Tautonia sociabilis]RUL81902.1 ATP-binding protein [Tautonia sociabilis]